LEITWSCCPSTGEHEHQFFCNLYFAALYSIPKIITLGQWNLPRYLTQNKEEKEML
jgi:hypothetical protein